MKRWYCEHSKFVQCVFRCSRDVRQKGLQEISIKIGRKKLSDLFLWIDKFYHNDIRKCIKEHGVLNFLFFFWIYYIVFFFNSSRFYDYFILIYLPQFFLSLLYKLNEKFEDWELKPILRISISHLLYKVSVPNTTE